MSGSVRSRLTELGFFTVLLGISIATIWLGGTSADFFGMATFTFSNWCGLLIALFCVLEIVSIMRQPDMTHVEHGAPGKVLLLTLLIIVYTFSLHEISYYAATGVFIPITLLCVDGTFSLRRAATVTVGWLLFVYLVFEQLFTIVLPK